MGGCSRAPAAAPARAGAAARTGGRLHLPDTYLVWAILCTVLCCLPFGIVSIVNATKVEKLWLMGNKEGARKASEDAKKWAIIGALTSVIVGFLYGIFLLIVAAAG